MSSADFLRLLALSAIWGASFPFMRLAVPVLGPSWLIFFRVGLAALFLLGVALWLGSRLNIQRHWRHYAIIGVLNSALPFFLYAYAAKTIPVALLSVLNATAPIFGAILTALLSRTMPRRNVVIGLCLGISGVTLLAGVESLHLPDGALWGIAAALGAALLYSIASAYSRTAPAIEPLANAHGSLWFATLCMVPGILTAPTPSTALLTPTVVLSVIGLGVLCSGVAFLLYFRLIANIGTTSALTVTFLIPLFGITFATLFMGESIGWHTLVGGGIVLLGTGLVTGFKPSNLWQRPLKS